MKRFLEKYFTERVKHVILFGITVSVLLYYVVEKILVVLNVINP